MSTNAPSKFVHEKQIKAGFEWTSFDFFVSSWLNSVVLLISNSHPLMYESSQLLIDNIEWWLHAPVISISRGRINLRSSFTFAILDQFHTFVVLNHWWANQLTSPLNTFETRGTVWHNYSETQLAEEVYCKNNSSPKSFWVGTVRPFLSPCPTVLNRKKPISFVSQLSRLWHINLLSRK